MRRKQESQPLGPNREAIAKLMIWCPLKARGCEWEGHISSSETHLNPLPDIRDILDRLGTSQFYTTLDGAIAF